MTIVDLDKSVSRSYCICVLLLKSAQHGKLIENPCVIKLPDASAQHKQT